MFIAWILSIAVVIAGNSSILLTSIFLQFVSVILLVFILFKKWEK